MLKGNTLFVFVLVVCVAAFVAGVVHLFVLRFEAGDVYPAYSSLRADPLGSKALYESLGLLPRMSVGRNYQPLSKLRFSKGTTVFYLGASVSEITGVFVGDLSVMLELERDLGKDLQAIAAGGSRLVLTLYPETRGAWIRRREERERREDEVREEQEESEKTNGENGEMDEEGESDTKRPRPISLAERWGLRVDYGELPVSYDDPYGHAVAYRKDIEGVPDSISWYSAVFFDELDDAWRVVYAWDDRPVIIERKFGAGTIVLSGDSYSVSNEAMRRERHPDLLAWLVGPNTNVVFDETHLGVAEEPGIATLVRKYRLYGLFAGLALLAGLFVWKNGVSFVPPYRDEPEESRVAAGKDFTAGLVNLLRRSISRKDILNVCFEEWKKSAHGRTGPGKQVEKIRDVIDAENARPATERDPVRCYQLISRILAEEKRV